MTTVYRRLIPALAEARLAMMGLSAEHISRFLERMSAGFCGGCGVRTEYPSGGDRLFGDD
jgi:hypothetical protein